MSANDIQFSVSFSTNSSNSVDKTNIGAMIICPDNTKTLRLYFTYLSSYGAFYIIYRKDGIWTSLGEIANRNVDIAQADMIIISNSITYRVTFEYI